MSQILMKYELVVRVVDIDEKLVAGIGRNAGDIPVVTYMAHTAHAANAAHLTHEVMQVRADVDEPLQIADVMIAFL